MPLTKQFSIQPQCTSIITSISHIPKWKIQLMHKRKQIQKSKSEIVIPSWKIELIKKLKENSENQKKKIDPNVPVIEENIVKVSQNIFVIRESKEKKRENSVDRIPLKFSSQKSFQIHEVVLLEDEMQKKEFPNQGIVSRLKNKFNVEPTEQNTLNHRKTSQKSSECISTNRNGYKSLPSNKTNKQNVKEFFESNLNQELKTPEVLTIKTPSVITSYKRNDYTRGRTASIDLMSPRKFKLNSNSVVKPLESVKTFEFLQSESTSENSNEPPKIPERKFTAPNFTPRHKKAPKLPPRNNKADKSSLQRTILASENVKLDNDSSGNLEEEPTLVLQKTPESIMPKEKQIVSGSPKTTITKNEDIENSTESFRNPNSIPDTIKPASIPFEKTKEIENITILQVSKQLPIIDASKLGEEKAKAYNELMANSKTFQIIPKSARNRSTNKSTTIDSSQKKINNIKLSEHPKIIKELQTNEVKEAAPIFNSFDKSIQKTINETDNKINQTDHDLKNEVEIKIEVEKKTSIEKVFQEIPSQKLSENIPEKQKFRPTVVSAQSKFNGNSLGQLRSTSTQVKKSGRTFTINPGKSKQRNQAINQNSNSMGADERKNTFTVTPKPRTGDITNENKTTATRKPRVDQIKVVGGYVKLEKSLLKKSNKKNEKKKSVRFAIENTTYQHEKNLNFNNNHQVFSRNMFVPTNDFRNNIIVEKESNIAVPNEPPYEKKTKGKLQSPPVKLDNDFENYIGEVVNQSKEDIITEAIPSQNDHFYSDAISNDLFF